MPFINKENKEKIKEVFDSGLYDIYIYRKTINNKIIFKLGNLKWLKDANHVFYCRKEKECCRRVELGNIEYCYMYNTEVQTGEPQILRNKSMDKWSVNCKFYQDILEEYLINKIETQRLEKMWPKLKKKNLEYKELEI